MFFIEHNWEQEKFGQVWGFCMEERLFLKIKQYSRDIFNGVTIEGEGKSDFVLQGVEQEGNKDNDSLINVPAESCTFIRLKYPSRVADDVAEMLKKESIIPRELQAIKDFPPDLLREIEEKFNELAGESS